MTGSDSCDEWRNPSFPSKSSNCSMAASRPTSDKVGVEQHPTKRHFDNYWNHKESYYAEMDCIHLLN